MGRTTRRHRNLTGAAAATLAAALALGACSSGTESTTGDADTTAAAAATDGGTEDDGSESELPEDDGSESELPEDEAAPAAVEEMTAEDGWLPLHDLELPEPGWVTLTVEGERVDLEAVCAQPGPVEGWAHHLFVFDVDASGETADGRRVTLNMRRELLVPEPPEAKFYDYLGQEGVTFRLTTYIGDAHGSAIRVSPSDGDSAGTNLPVLHVSADGGFTVDEQIGLAPMSAEDALHGNIQVAGQCQAGWPDVLS